MAMGASPYARDDSRLAFLAHWISLAMESRGSVLIDGRGSYSIDQQRYNGQFGGNCFWEIKNGKKTRMVSDVTYNAITTDFWGNLDAVGPASTWEHHGLTGDAKGQPGQSNSVSHGCVPARFKGVNIVNIGRGEV